MSDHESSHKHGDPSSEPGGADEVAAAPHDAHAAGHEGAGGQGVGVGVGEPSTFEPEEDPTTLPDEPSASRTD